MTRIAPPRRPAPAHPPARDGFLAGLAGLAGLAVVVVVSYLQVLTFGPVAGGWWLLQSLAAALAGVGTYHAARAHLRTRARARGGPEGFDPDRCPCGQPLHYADAETEARVRELVATLGPNLPIRTPEGTWLVPRHWIALHGLAAQELPRLGFPKLPDQAADQ